MWRRRPLWPVIATAITRVALQVSRVLGDALVVTKAMTASTIGEIFFEEEQIRVENHGQALRGTPERI